MINREITNTHSPLNSPQGEKSYYVAVMLHNDNSPLEGAGGDENHHKLMKTLLL